MMVNGKQQSGAMWKSLNISPSLLDEVDKEIDGRSILVVKEEAGFGIQASDGLHIYI